MKKALNLLAMFALTAGLVAAAPVKVAKTYSDQSVLNQVFAQEGSNFGLFAFAGVLASPVVNTRACGGNPCSVQAILNMSLYEDSVTHQRGLGVYLLSGGGSSGPVSTTQYAIQNADNAGGWVENTKILAHEDTGNMEMDGDLTITGDDVNFSAASGIHINADSAAGEYFRIRHDVDVVGSSDAFQITDDFLGSEADLFRVLGNGDTIVTGILQVNGTQIVTQGGVISTTGSSDLLIDATGGSGGNVAVDITGDLGVTGSSLTGYQALSLYNSRDSAPGVTTETVYSSYYLDGSTDSGSTWLPKEAVRISARKESDFLAGDATEEDAALYFSIRRDGTLNDLAHFDQYGGLYMPTISLSWDGYMGGVAHITNGGNASIGVGTYGTDHSAAGTSVLLGSPTYTNTSGASNIVSIAPTINQASGTATTNVLQVQPTLTAIGSGGLNLLSVGSAASPGMWTIPSSGSLYSSVTGSVLNMGSTSWVGFSDNADGAAGTIGDAHFAYVGSGNIGIYNSAGARGTLTANAVDLGGGAMAFRTTGTPHLYVSAVIDSFIPFQVRQSSATQSANLTEWTTTGAGAVLSRIDPNGRFLGPLLVEANTAGVGSPNVITAAESGSVYTNEGATAENYHTLPTPVAGLTFTFMVQDADGLRITCATPASEQVYIGASPTTLTTGYANSTTIGSSVTVTAINSTTWVASASTGTWVVN